jgi:hypothetical protein
MTDHLAVNADTPCLKEKDLQRVKQQGDLLENEQKALMVRPGKYHFTPNKIEAFIKFFIIH